MVYADREGHIGYQAPGLIPIRQSGNDGSRPVAGWRPENDWTGQYIPFDALPNVLDPEEGFVVAANQAVAGPDYPSYLTDDWDRGYRSTRIRNRIEADPRLSVAEMAALQNDDLNPMAARLVPYLLDVDDLGSGYYRDGQDLLRSWDFHQPAGQRRRGVLQRRVACPARPDLPRRAARVAVARGRAAVVRGGDRAAGRPDRELVGRPGDRGRRWRPATTCCAWRMHGRARRADQPAGAARGGLGLG